MQNDDLYSKIFNLCGVDLRKANKRLIARQMALIVIMAFFKNNTLKLRAQHRLRLAAGITLDIGHVRFKGFHTLAIRDIYLRGNKKPASLAIRCGEVRWRIRSLLKLLIRKKRTSGPILYKLVVASFQYLPCIIRCTGITVDPGDGTPAGRMSIGQLALHVVPEKAATDGYPLRMQGDLQEIQVQNRGFNPGTTGTIQFRRLEFDIHTMLSIDWFAISDNSFVSLESLQLFLKGRFRWSKPDHMEMECGLKEFRLEELIRSLGFLSHHADKVRTEGTLSFGMKFIFSFDDPLDFLFSSFVTDNGFDIIDRGGWDMDYLNGPFIHRVPGASPIQIELSSNNPSFLRLADIPELFMKTVITTEDPNFLFHNGFDQNSFASAIAENIRRMRIIKGGSTITMQLVRNLLLGHNRNIFRKMEELLITWFLEEFSSVPKSRILQLYLNIIEMGPGVYGLKDACDFYFGKRPTELTFTECLVLTYIIPRPLHFFEALKIKSPQLIKNLRDHIETYAKKMHKRELVPAAELSNLTYVVTFGNGLGTISL
jgi:hypothetical protein